MRLLPLFLLLAACSEYDYVQETDTVRDEFRIEGAQSDILFVGDTSFSMQRELLTLGQHVQDFVERLDSASQDWQLIAVTGPSGCGNDTIFTPDTPDLASRFAAAITTEPGGDDVDEWGLHNAMRGVLRSGPGQCNEGFVRAGATLHVIFLSDEDDNSPGWEQGGTYWRDYVDPILYAKESESLVRMSAVGGPVPDGCEGADPGYGYADAVAATQGEFVSICDEWVDDLEILADASVVRETFELSAQPILDTLVVEHNEEARLEGWAYEPGTNAVRFLDDLPRGGDRVEITYDAEPE